MKNVNIGIVNLVISNNLKEAYFNNALITESKQVAFDLFEVVKNSSLLQMEFKVFNNLENKHIENDQIATRYIDNNIKLFEVYTLEEIEEERKKINDFINESEIPVNENADLYNAINVLITESLTDSDKVNIDKLHESFVLVLNHIKTPKQSLLENVDVETINEEVIEIAVGKFNEKYASLNEDDKNLLQTLIKASNKEKQALLETYKTETLSILESVKDENQSKAIQKIKEMVFNMKNVDDNIIGLHELKKELI